MRKNLLLEDPADGEQIRLFLGGDPDAKKHLEDRWFGPISERIARLGWWRRWKANRLMKELLRDIETKHVNYVDAFYQMDYIDILTRRMAGTWDQDFG